MMDKDKLRKADIFSGAAIFLTGGFIVGQALKMPMKDSWGGVQNVWYVSPAIFPLFVGAMIMILGGMLVRTGLKEAGRNAVKNVMSYLFSDKFSAFLKLDQNIRFYAVITALVSFVYLFIPRVDFFLAAVLFLMVFISMFYLDDPGRIKRLLGFYLALLVLFLPALLVAAVFAQSSPYILDILVMVYIPAYGLFAYFTVGKDQKLKKKLKTSFTVAVAAPFIIGAIFKYLLMVPMPFEGVVVLVMDYFWYM